MNDSQQLTEVSPVLWAANVKERSFAEQLDIANMGGFRELTVFPFVYRRELASGRTARELLSMANDRGIVLNCLDGMSGWAPITMPSGTDEWLREALAVPVQDQFAMCEALGLKSIVAVGAFDKGALELPIIVEAFARFCELAGKRGIWVDVEFMPFWGISDLATAWEIVKQSGCSNCGIMFDTWCFLRGHADFDSLSRIPPGRIVNVQVVDALKRQRAATLFDDAVHHRLFAGDGELAVEKTLAALHKLGGVRTMGPEVFSDEVDTWSAAKVAQRAADTTRAIMTKTGFSGRWKV
jgi:sugar phosphate isomerase/epimerase